MHFSLTDFYNKKRDAYWQHLLDDTPTATFELNGQKIATLEPTLHAFYIFQHLYEHLMELGVGLRQFCDWAVMMHSCREQIDHAKLRQYAETLGMDKAMRACGVILIDYLGLPEEDFPYRLTDKDRKYSKRRKHCKFVSTENTVSAVSPDVNGVIDQYEIYRTYFTNEISISDDLIYIKNTSLKNYFTLIKNLEIIPYLLSNSTCYQIYKYETTNKIADESIKNNQNFYLEICQKIDFLNMNSYEHSNKNIFGKYFIFFKFIRSLIKMSQITFEKIFNSKNLDDTLIPEEMFILFLQKIEQSEGFGNFTKINNISHNYKTSNIIPPNFRIKFDGKNEEKEEINDNNIILNNNEEKIDINQNIEQYEPKYINYINEVYGKDLLNLYKTIVNFGDQFNFQYMKSKAFLKFLSDSNLIKNKQNNFGIKLNEIDIFFIKLCLLNKNNEKFLTQKNINIKSNNKNNNSTTVNVSYGEIDYPTFIIAIEILSRYLFSNLPSKQAIDKLIVEYILNSKELLIKNNKINEIEQKIENLKQLQNNEEIISFLQIIHKAFYPLFSFYTKESEGLMSLHTFMKFVKDFEIFPYLIGKAKLNSLFNSIAQYSSFVKKNESYIEHSLFVDLIALMALEMIYPEPEPSPVEKMMIFIEKISQSGGVGKIAMRTGNNRIGNWANFIDVFKTAYPSYFEENEINEDNINNKDDFENFMKDNYEEDLNSNNNDNNENNINENNDVNNIINNENINSNEIEIKENNF